MPDVNDPTGEQLRAVMQELNEKGYPAHTVADYREQLFALRPGDFADRLKAQASQLDDLADQALRNLPISDFNARMQTQALLPLDPKHKGKPFPPDPVGPPSNISYRKGEWHIKTEPQVDE